MIQLPPLPDDLPWKTPAYLLLDGVSIPDLARRLYRWDNQAYCLYQRTRWHELSDISPYLVAVKGVDDPLLADFQANAAQEWGYLMFSGVKGPHLWNHWRHLISVKHPSGVEVMPRIADPSTMHQLFGLAAQAGSARWFGPVTHACLPDGVDALWHQHKRPEQARAEPDTYQLNDVELAALGDAEFRNIVSALEEHLLSCFPDLMAAFAAPGRRPYAQRLAEEAYQKGFASEQEITLYANIFGYLAGQPLTDHPDLLQLLTSTTHDTPIKRLQHAARLAENLAANRQGCHP